MKKRISQRRLLDRQLDRMERMLERCIEADKAANRKRRKLEDPFYQKLKILMESKKEWEEEKRKRAGTPDEES